MDRRRALGLTFAACLAPAITTRSVAAQDDIGGLIEPPESPMIYSRTVTRDLVDGNQFSVSRRFTVTFRQFADGFMVHGEQDDVVVDAPPQLTQFAEMEGARDESAIFPLALDPFGQILSRDRRAVSDEALQAAAEQTLAALSGQSLDDQERATLEGFVSAVYAAGQRITAHLPVDVFAPAGSPRRDERLIALPQGSEGRIITSFAGEKDLATGLMRTAQREIVTEVESSRRITGEVWSLGPA